MYESKHLYNLKEGEIELFIEEREFYELRKNLTIKTLEYQHRFEEANDNLYKIYLTKDTNPDYLNDISNLLSEYRNSTVEDLKKIYKERNKVVKLLSGYIKQLME